MRLWRDHSRTIVGMAFGALIIAVAWYIWPEGGSTWDIVSSIGAVLLGIGLDGIVNNYFREKARPED